MNSNEDDIYSEPKFLVLFSMLVNLFSTFCFKCKSCKPTVDMIKIGTLVSVIQNCPECGDKAFKWRSQPLVFTKYPAGNIALSFGVLIAGASMSKILLVFQHMAFNIELTSYIKNILSGLLLLHTGKRTGKDLWKKLRNWKTLCGVVMGALIPWDIPQSMELIPCFAHQLGRLFILKYCR